ncbi:Crp/Fnr family transcriptional regulator [Thiohalobacter sp.]|uniref:Crp/Fnr family transcriptional regulator n=1 Tax=Thiohalobacter sp. TaxID=2025948 RepID=UPI00263567DA|nr:Crp/Fnr family transcriptional regulator [Thiohalobacter sp.]
MSDLIDRLNELAARLPESGRQTLVDFAEFLCSRQQPPAPDPVASRPMETPAAPVIETPRPIPRPEQESVIKALKRLAATYPMLDKQKMLNETSGLVTQHVIMRRDAGEVIDELEAVFARCYEEYRAERGG